MANALNQVNHRYPDIGRGRGTNAVGYLLGHSVSVIWHFGVTPATERSAYVA